MILGGFDEDQPVLAGELQELVTLELLSIVTIIHLLGTP